MSIAWLRRRQSTHSASKGFDCVAFPNPSPSRGSTASPGTRESKAATDDPMDMNFLTDLPISLSPRSSLSARSGSMGKHKTEIWNWEDKKHIQKAIHPKTVLQKGLVVLPFCRTLVALQSNCPTVPGAIVRPQRTVDAHTKSVLPSLQDMKLRKKARSSCDAEATYQVYQVFQNLPYLGTFD